LIDSGGLTRRTGRDLLGLLEQGCVRGIVDTGGRSRRRSRIRDRILRLKCGVRPNGLLRDSDARVADDAGDLLNDLLDLEIPR
jgi:hypothetical protein